TTATLSQEVLELKEKLASLQVILNKSTHNFNVVVHPKQKSNKWIANIEHATLKGLKEYIRKMYQLLALENDGAELNFMNDGDKYSLQNNQDLLCELYELSDDLNPSIDVYFVFQYGCANTKEEKYKEALRKLFDKLKTRVMITPIDISYETTKSIYSYSFLASATYLFKSQIKIVPEKLVEGFAQATVQMESSLSRKRKANEIDNEYDMNKVWGFYWKKRRSFREIEENKKGKVRRPRRKKN
ncbi:14934_t:CDS:2, partial [Funneliformis geosporum]